MDTEANTLSSSLTCELNIIRAKNIEFILPGRIFVRYYLVGKAGERIRLNSREISSTADPYWNEHISLECCGAANPMKDLSQQSVVFELRWRSTAPIIGRIVGSKLLGRAEIAWRDVLGSTGMSMEKWTTLATPGTMVVGLKPPALQLGMKVRLSEKVGHVHSRRTVGSKRCKEYRCGHDSCNGVDNEIFALAAALEVI
ncbi:uncharacterized protein LOC131242005 [Magnolia sinica]|uniref:uncharacterized protein LOC131242005 n=1 Tax=Magnolia sinica TaxID=86752 RepID=UPI002659ED45|nr:uncharacterized protein LOC131242005 [Magnolia sinica]